MLFFYFINIFIPNFSKFHCATPSISPTVTIFVQKTIDFAPKLSMQGFIIMHDSSSSTGSWLSRYGRASFSFTKCFQATRNAVKWLPTRIALNWKNTLSSKGPNLQLWLICTNQIQIKNSIYIDFAMENQVKIITNLEFPKFSKLPPSENRKKNVKKKFSIFLNFLFY